MLCCYRAVCCVEDSLGMSDCGLAGASTQSQSSGNCPVNGATELLQVIVSLWTMVSVSVCEVLWKLQRYALWQLLQSWTGSGRETDPQYHFAGQFASADPILASVSACLTVITTAASTHVRTCASSCCRMLNVRMHQRAFQADET